MRNLQLGKKGKAVGKREEIKTTVGATVPGSHHQVVSSVNHSSVAALNGKESRSAYVLPEMGEVLSICRLCICDLGRISKIQMFPKISGHQFYKN